MSKLLENGYSIAKEDESPDHVIINSCTVTSKADSKNRLLVSKARQKFPNAKIWVTGCYAETDREVVESIPGVFAVVGNSEKSTLPDLISRFDLESNVNLQPNDNLEFSFSYRAKTDSKFTSSPSFHSITDPNSISESSTQVSSSNRFSYLNAIPQGHTRAYLKVQDGCNRTCSYCKIPSARGKGVSRDFRDTIDQVQYLQDNGIHEIILTGVNLGWYKNENGEKAFAKLLEGILNQLTTARLRISSLEPPDVNADLRDLLQHPRFCKYLHIPLQSGSTKVLRAMNRTYTRESFQKRIEMVKSEHPNLFLGTDVIAGFPNETESEFHETISLLNELEFSKIHPFPYSPRANTSALSMGDPVTGPVKKERVHRLIALSSELHAKFAQKQIGSVQESILESDGQFLSDLYCKIKTHKPVDQLPIGDLYSVRIESYFSSPKGEGTFLGTVLSAGVLDREPILNGKEFS